MLGRGNPFAKWEQIYDYYEGQKPETIYSKKVFGIILERYAGLNSALGSNWRDRSVILPEKPNLFQKVIAFLLIQMRVAHLARKEKELIDYAYSWSSARNIFRW